MTRQAQGMGNPPSHSPSELLKQVRHLEWPLNTRPVASVSLSMRLSHRHSPVLPPQAQTAWPLTCGKVCGSLGLPPCPPPLPASPLCRGVSGSLSLSELVFLTPILVFFPPASSSMGL